VGFWSLDGILLWFISDGIKYKNKKTNEILISNSYDWTRDVFKEPLNLYLKELQSKHRVTIKSYLYFKLRYKKLSKDESFLLDIR
jgi:hypothetical protein